MLEADPVLGAAIANYPSNRARLLIIAGAVLAVVWFVVTVALLPVDDAGLAATITATVIGIATLAAGWYVSHLWNREVVLYQQGFSYREGSYVAYILYFDVVSIRQRAERLSFFGGLARYTLFRTVIKTRQNETLMLTNLYKHMDELGKRLDAHVHQTLRPRIEQALGRGERVSFTATLTMTQDGLHDGERDLLWMNYGGYRIANRRLLLKTRSGETWFSAPLGEIDNITVLLDLLPKQESVK
jgi:hypothetical protein